MATQNNHIERRAAKKLAASYHVNYTEALRRVRHSALQPSEILHHEFFSDTPRPGDIIISETDSLAPLKANTSAEFSFEDCLKDYSYNGRYAVRTSFGDDPAEQNHKVRINHLTITDAVGASATDLLAALLKPVDGMPTRVISWDAGGGLSKEMDGVHTDITEFHRELTCLFSDGNSGPVIVAVDSVDDLLTGKAADAVTDEVARMLIAVLRTGRAADISLYVTTTKLPHVATSGFFGETLRSLSELVLMGAAPLELTHSAEELAALPEMTKGWLTMNSDSSLWQVRVPR